MNKVIDLMDRLERVKLDRLNRPPVDLLSASLFSMEDEMMGLDEAGRALLLAELNRQEGEDAPLDLTIEGLEKWISDIRKDRAPHIIY